MRSSSGNKNYVPAASVLKLPLSAEELIIHYRNLHIQGIKVVCPYHINTNLRSKNRAMVGKGRPEEIEAAAERYLTKFQMNAHGDTKKLLEYLNACGFGIDCSGFASWVLNCITLETLNKSLWQCLTFPNIKRSLVSKLRPVENISANLLTSPRNTVRITDINLIRPGDLIRFIGGGHVVVISEVGLSKQGKVSYFKYVQSSVGYGKRKGVDEDLVHITNPEGYLLEQLWDDKLIYEALKETSDNSRVVRLRAFKTA